MSSSNQLKPCTLKILRNLQFFCLGRTVALRIPCKLLRPDSHSTPLKPPNDVK